MLNHLEKDLRPEQVAKNGLRIEEVQGYWDILTIVLYNTAQLTLERCPFTNEQHGSGIGEPQKKTTVESAYQGWH